MPPTYTDVAVGNDYYPYVEAVVAVLPGAPTPPLFAPDTLIDVAEVSGMLVTAVNWKSAGQEPFGTPTAPPLAVDITATTFGFQFLQQCLKMGCFGGDERVDFDPGEILTTTAAASGALRKYVIAYMLRSVTIREVAAAITSPQRFTDVPDSDVMYGWVEKGWGLGIVGVAANATFSPATQITRKAYYVWLKRAFAIPYVTTPPPAEVVE